MKTIYIIFLAAFLTSCAGDPNRDVVYFGKLLIKKEAYEDGIIKEANSETLSDMPAIIDKLEICFLLNKEDKLECVDMDPAYLKAEKVSYDRKGKSLFNFVAKPQDISLKAAKLIGPQTFKYQYKNGDRIKTSTPNRADFVYLGDFLVMITEDKNEDQAPSISFFSACNPKFLENKLMKNEKTKKTSKPYTSCFEAGRVIHTKGNNAFTLLETMDIDE